MKTFFISDHGSVILDRETEELSSLESKREGISRIWIAKEPMDIIVNRDDKKYELSAKKDDIIILFYEQYFDYPVIVVKSKNWLKNIKSYEKKMYSLMQEKVGPEVCCSKEACDSID